MKKRFLLLTAICFALLLSGCGTSASPSASDISELYKDYSAVAKADNKARISISKIDTRRNVYSISIFASHPVLSQSEENAAVLANRLRVVNAEKPDTEVAFKLSTVHSVLTKSDGTKTQSYYPAVNISMDEKAKFIIIYFEGIGKEEVPELRTPPMFFIVELDKKEPKVLTETPLLAGGLFD